MRKYIVLYHAPSSFKDQMKDATPEQMKAGMESWMAWAGKCGSALVDMGSPLGGGQTVTQAGSAPSDKGVVGYSVLQAESGEAARALVEGHPHLGWDAGCEIELHECLPLPG